MNHAAEKFTFKDPKGKEVHLTTVEYNFEAFDVLINRFGEEALEEFNRTGKINRDIKLSDVEEDFPLLLEGDKLKSINWKKQKYDTLLEVYVFFIKYKRNAMLRNIELEKEMLASNLEKLQTIMSSLPETISEKLNIKSTKRKL